MAQWRDGRRWSRTLLALAVTVIVLGILVAIPAALLAPQVRNGDVMAACNMPLARLWTHHWQGDVVCVPSETNHLHSAEVAFGTSLMLTVVVLVLSAGRRGLRDWARGWWGQPGAVVSRVGGEDDPPSGS